VKKSKNCGYEYYISREMLRDYQRKSPKIRLLWLFQGNLLRSKYPKSLIKIQDRFRAGTPWNSGKAG